MTLTRSPRGDGWSAKCFTVEAKYHPCTPTERTEP